MTYGPKAMSAAVQIVFSYWLTFAGDRTPGRRGSVGMTPSPLTVPLEEELAALTSDESVAAQALHRAETRFTAWVVQRFPEHNLGGWEARLGSIDGPLLSRYWSGFLANE